MNLLPKIVEVYKKLDFEVRNTQTPSIQYVGDTQLFSDTLPFFTRSENFFKLTGKPNDDDF